MEKLKPDATGIYVAAHQAPAAIEEAIAAGVPLIVAVAEHIPIHDILRVGSYSMGQAILLTTLDTFDIENPIAVSFSRCKLAWYYLCYW
jgi:succinyl-CoA synthetase alpha subunit